MHHFDPRCVQILNNLVAKVGAKVVITSTWRNKYSQNELTEILLQANLSLDIIGFTPDLKEGNDYVIRGNEILKWCIDNEELLGCKWNAYHNFAILDDNTDFLLWQTANFFKTDRYSGLTLTIKKQIERHFEMKSE